MKHIAKMSSVLHSSHTLCSDSEQAVEISFSAVTRLGDRKGIRPVKIGCWFVGGDDLTGAIHDL